MLYLFPLPSFDNGCGRFLIGIHCMQQYTPQKLHMVAGFFLALYSSSQDGHFSPVLSTAPKRSSMTSKKISSLFIYQMYCLRSSIFPALESLPTYSSVFSKSKSLSIQEWHLPQHHSRFWLSVSTPLNLLDSNCTVWWKCWLSWHLCHYFDGCVSYLKGFYYFYTVWIINGRFFLIIPLLILLYIFIQLKFIIQTNLFR